LIPSAPLPTLSLTCTIAKPATMEGLHPRPGAAIAQRAEKYLAKHRSGRRGGVRPESRSFFIFDNVQFDSKSNGTFYIRVDSEEAIWNTGRDESA